MAIVIDQELQVFYMDFEVFQPTNNGITVFEHVFIKLQVIRRLFFVIHNVFGVERVMNKVFCHADAALVLNQRMERLPQEIPDF
ncbi:Uncharacterised protein [Ewingella americana]|uniref:Uncharacterized protein n=1 Tax=Ewingella americana TaxID=41202 RepID=A0A377NGI3_9GAMM|nr:Uncharacterised protein [Ewingella americana]